MRRKFYTPISGTPHGSLRSQAPYRTFGKYHHRRDLLFTPQWGREVEQKVSRSFIPLGSTLVWQKDAPRAWPWKDNAVNHMTYIQNEERYLAPALKAKDSAVRHYLMKQLDPSGSSGIGLFNVRWRHGARNTNQDTLSEQDIDGLPGDVPKHLAAVINENHPDVLGNLLNHTIPRQKIRILDKIVKESSEHLFHTHRIDKHINPYPVVGGNLNIINQVKPCDILRINPRHRPADTKSPVWRHREYHDRKRTKQFLMKTSIVKQEEKIRFMRSANRRRLSVES